MIPTKDHGLAAAITKRIFIAILSTKHHLIARHMSNILTLSNHLNYYDRNIAAIDSAIIDISAKRDDTDHQIALLKAQVGTLSARLKGQATPSQLGWGIAVLSLLAVTGILLPLILMPQLSRDFSPLHKVLVVAGFGAGLVAVLVYITALARHQTWRARNARA